MGRDEMIGWVLGLFLGLLLIVAGIIWVMETMVLRDNSDDPRASLEQGSEQSK
jgi:hypothetical protein